ncbi:hypothetical protein [Agromyces sp. H66]|uniref:hypothetical protein n=1 Tax=Agromyces sp. H66 TaxID=2529859 RepID=UPI0010AA07E1|nr:hypothetical protein [Agromyces sp. H66]
MSATSSTQAIADATSGRRGRLARAAAFGALITSSAMAGLGLVWLVASGLNPFGTEQMQSLVGGMLGADAVAGATLAVGLAGVLLAAILVLRRRGDDPGGSAALGAAALAVALCLVVGNVHIIALAGYLFGFSAVIAGLVTVAVLLVRAPRLGVPLLVGLIGVVSAAVWMGLTGEAVVEFAVAFGRALLEDAPNLAVTVAIVAAMAAWATVMVIGVGRSPAGRRFETWLVRHRRVLTILAAAAPLPYAVARASWLTPWPLFGPIAEDLPPIILTTGLMLGTGAVAASLLTLGLILPWGLTFPRWMPRIGGRPVPAAAAVVPGSIAAGALCVSAGSMLLINTDAPVDVVILNLVLPLWFWGPSLALAVWGYAAWRRRLASYPA